MLLWPAGVKGKFTGCGSLVIVAAAAPGLSVNVAALGEARRAVEGAGPPLVL